MRKDHFNLLLEIFSLFVFLGSLTAIVALGILAFNIVGNELANNLPAPSKLEEIVQSPAGYRFSILIFAFLASFPLFTAIMIRSFLVRPEPFPWIDPEEPST